MAALTATPATIYANAIAAREEAQRLRLKSATRRLEVRRSRVESRRRLSTASVTFAWLERARTRRFRSAWSDLPWQLPNGELDRVLVPYDGKS